MNTKPTHKMFTCTAMGYFHPCLLLQSLAISRIRNSETLNQVCKLIYKQANICCVKIQPCAGLCVYAQISRVGKKKCAMHH